jgi:hypothetical protein
VPRDERFAPRPPRPERGLRDDVAARYHTASYGSVPNW